MRKEKNCKIKRSRTPHTYTLTPIESIRLNRNENAIRNGNDNTQKNTPKRRERKVAKQHIDDEE